MAYAGNTRSLPYVRNFSEAHTHFIQTKPVNARKHTDIWTPDTRPLKDSGATHYLLRRGIDPDTGRLFFDLVLYKTTMARYHEPVGDTQTRYYRWHSSQTSKGFLWDVAGVNWLNHIKDTEGIERAVPIGYRGCDDPVDGEQFGCKVVMRDGRLDVASSAHEPLFKRVSTEDDKQRTAATRERIASLLDLMALRMQHFEENCDIDIRRGRAFGGKHSHGYNRHLLRRLVDVCIPVEEAMTSEAIESFFNYAQECFNVLASKRSVAMTAAQNTGNYWHSRRPATDDPNALDRPITIDDLRKSVTNNLLTEFRVKQQSQRVPLPTFMAAQDFPCSNRSYY